jgi:hypothetical protein
VNDRELLERAAKAAGIVGHWERDSAFVQERYYFNVPYDNQNMLTGFRWDPLHDDGDALRLAVKLGMDIGVYLDHDGEDHEGRTYANTRHLLGYGTDGIASWQCHQYQREDHGADPCAATRRAIVRAAAEIGKAPATP